jgi:hypothetical protein
MAQRVVHRRKQCHFLFHETVILKWNISFIAVFLAFNFFVFFCLKIGNIKEHISIQVSNFVDISG